MVNIIKKGGLNSYFNLQFVTSISINQKKIIVMKEEVSKRIECKWSYSVVACVVGNGPSYHYFNDFIVRTWNPTSTFEILTQNNGFFILDS